MTFSGRTAIVTGGTGELGRVCVDHLFNQGMNLAIPFSLEKSLANLPDDILNDKSRILVHRSDLTVEQNVDTFAETVLRKFSSIDFLIKKSS